MKSALSDFIFGKKGIYGILHIIILIMSLFLVISISVDTFKGIPFYTQSSYMKVQLCICLWFLFDFVLEFFLAKHKGRYLRTHFIFLLVAIPYQNIIAYYGWTFSDEITYLLRFIPLLRGGCIAALETVIALKVLLGTLVGFYLYRRRSCLALGVWPPRCDGDVVVAGPVVRVGGGQRGDCGVGGGGRHVVRLHRAVHHDCHALHTRPIAIRGGTGAGDGCRDGIQPRGGEDDGGAFRPFR